MWRVEFFKIGKHDFTFIREMRLKDVFPRLLSLLSLDVTDDFDSDAKIHQKRLETNDHGKGSHDDD